MASTAMEHPADVADVGLQIVALIGQGKSPAQVARALGVTEPVVRRHLSQSLTGAGLDEWPIRMAVLLRGQDTQAARLFSPRERQIAELIRAGHSLLDIAEALHIAVGTVRAHLHRALAKCGIGHTPSGIRAHLCRHVAAGRVASLAAPLLSAAGTSLPGRAAPSVSLPVSGDDV